MATPWFGIDCECDRVISTELRAAWREAELVSECRQFEVATLIIDGAQDVRPRWAVDSVQHALPVVRRVVLDGAGHLPWADRPDEFATPLRGVLGRVADVAGRQPTRRRLPVRPRARAGLLLDGITRLRALAAPG
jgi:proline iminopeptidase